MRGIREYGIHIGVFVVIIFLTLKFLLPQFDSLLVTRGVLSKTSSRLMLLETKLDILEGLDRAETDQKLDTLNKALPNQKDIGTLVGGLEYASGKAQAPLGSFSITVGSLATASGAPSKIGVPIIQFNISVRGDIDSIIRILQELNNTLPILQVDSVSFTGELATISLSYFYKPQVLQVGTPEEPLPKLTLNQENVLNKINTRVAPPLGGESGGSRADPFH